MLPIVLISSKPLKPAKIEQGWSSEKGRFSSAHSQCFLQMMVGKMALFVIPVSYSFLALNKSEFSCQCARKLDQ